MATYHTVKQGDYLPKIAARYGFADWHTIWEHSENAELKEKRQNSNVLFPGDRLFIPDKQVKQIEAGAGQLHRFKVKMLKVYLRIVLKQLDNQPLANAECELLIDGKVYQLTTNGDGLIEQEIPKVAEAGRLAVKDSNTRVNIEIPFKIGHLDPVEEASGQRARLNNLGYYTGEVGQASEQEMKSAIEEFQCDNELTVDGICGPDTQAKLKEIHGC